MFGIRKRYLAVDIHRSDMALVMSIVNELHYNIAEMRKSTLGDERLYIRFKSTFPVRLDWRKFAARCGNLPFQAGYTIHMFG